MFDHVVLRGAKEPGDPVASAILWGYRPAATLQSWTIVRSAARTNGRWGWTLSARTVTAEAFMLGQTPLIFTAPRRKAGFWHWPILGALPYCHTCRGWHPVGKTERHTGAGLIRATLGPPSF